MAIAKKRVTFSPNKERTAKEKRKERAGEKDKSKAQLLQELRKLRSEASTVKVLRKECARLKQENLDVKELYGSILDDITCGVWVADENDVLFYVNRGMEMIAGVRHQKLLGCGVLRDFSDSTIGYFKQYYLEAKATLQPVYYDEVPVVTPAGKQTYQSGWLIPKRKNGRFGGMVCTVEDITNQKQTRSALRESEAKYRELVENAMSIIMRMDMKGNITFFNEFAQKFFGFREDEIIGKNVVGTIVPETNAYKKDIRRMLKNIGTTPELYANIEHENVRKDGEKAWITWTNKVLYGEGGRITEILSIGTDITERKYQENLLKKCRHHLEGQVRDRTAQLTKVNEELEQEIAERRWTEDILRNSETKYRLVVENANEGIVVSQDGFLKYANPKAEKITGYPEEVLLSRPFIEFIHPDDRDMVMERYFKRLKGDHLPNVYSCRLIDGEGNVKWLELNAVLITWMGRPASLTFFSNITERKRAEERLRLFESAIRQTKDSIIITTAKPDQPSSKIVFVNPAFTEMTGYTADEVICKPSLILQGPTTDNMEWVKLESTVSRGKAFYVETINHRKDGTKFNLESQIAPIRDERGKVTHFISTQRDITERKKVEERVKTYQEQLRSLASELSLAEERERRRLATNLHDHIGQTLAITKLKLGELRNSLPSEDTGELLGNIWSLVDRTIKYTKSLTFELSPPILYELGFEATIEWLGEQMQKQYNISFDFADDGLPKPLDENISVLMFQAVRELFMNVVKHARAQKMSVCIQRENGNMRVVVEDDGVGFDTTKIESTSFGFFSIRERLKHFGGMFVIETRPGRGTRVILTAPVKVNEGEGK